MMLKPKKWFLITSLFFVISLLFSACQTLAKPTQPTEESLPTATLGVVQAFNPADPQSTKPTQPLAIRIKPGKTPEFPPGYFPTPGPLKFSQRGLPASLAEKVHLPENAIWVENTEETYYYISPYDVKRPPYIYAKTQWTYALVAPFFTVRDSISLTELRMLLLGSKLESEDLQNRQILTPEGEFDAIKKLVNLSNTSNLQAIKADNKKLVADAWGENWAIVPFEALRPEWKVIAIDGVSPLDATFEPEKYPLTLHVFIGCVYETPDEDPRLEGVLPPPNRDPQKMTSLFMSGVTAMARDTAFIMETEGVLFPGTEIRDFMRAADLTHISNEVSFYEECKFPDPDYEGFIFCSNPEYIKLLDDLGADVIELTGNHNNDVFALYRVDSVPFTLDLYKKYGMQWYAGGTNVQEAKAPLLIEHNGNRLAFIGCNSYGPDMAWAKEDSSGAAPCEDFGWLKDEVSRLKAEGYIPIVTFQFQEDYLQEATSLQLRDFRDVAEAKPAIINGSQSHVAKAMEFYQDSFIHYGLGNLFFDQPDFYITYDSFVQEHFFFEGRHISTRLHTITIEETGKPRPMTQEERQTFLSHIFSVSEPLRSSQ